MNELLFILAMTALAGCLWALVCNRKTFAQRGELIEFVFDVARSNNNDTRYVNELNNVHYETHLMQLFFFNDPYKMFSDDFMDMFRKWKGDA